MRSLIISALLISTSAFAGEWVTKKISFSPRTYTGGSAHFYSCDAVENMAEGHLKALRAENIRLRCSGGINRGWSSPVFLTGTFEFETPSTNDMALVISRKGNESCDLNSEFLDYIVRDLPGVTVLKRRASCFGGRLDRWSYDIQIME
jgi:hypothetical protein